MNVVLNSTYILILVFFSLMFVMMLNIGDRLMDKTLNITNNNLNITNSTIINSAEESFETTKNYLRQGCDFLLSLVTVSLLMSSFTTRHDVMSYLLSFVGAVIISSLLIYIASYFYDAYIEKYSALGLNLEYLPGWFIDNVNYLFGLNILAGLISFIFIKRGG